MAGLAAEVLRAALPVAAPDTSGRPARCSFGPSPRSTLGAVSVSVLEAERSRSSAVEPFPSGTAWGELVLEEWEFLPPFPRERSAWVAGRWRGAPVFRPVKITGW